MRPRPGLIITAAFIGPGTITTCTLAGRNLGYTLLWVLIFATFATLVLQEMSGRLSLVGGMGLGKALHDELPGRIIRLLGIIIVICAVGIGNAAYQTGNLLGASLGLSALTGTEVQVWPLIVGFIAFAVLWIGSYATLGRVSCGFVVMMSVCFVLTALIARPNLSQLLEGMFLPRLSEESLFVALGLVGTTIVPYNLFLYSSIVQERWSERKDLRKARMDLLTAVLLGGGISMAVVTTASAAFFQRDLEVFDAVDLAIQLEPLLGSWAQAAMAVGLFGAGMSSAITAPLATAYAVQGMCAWKEGLTETRFRLVWMAVLSTGIIFSSIGFQPVSAILFAQVANGIMLPFVAMFLLYAANSRRLLGNEVNSWKANLAGGLVILMTLVLGFRGAARILDF
jgi:manganese transport protein